MAALWQQIHDDFRARIESGELRPNNVLPSDQEIADQWGVSRLTAHRALYELQRNGYVTRRRRLGTVVCERRPLERATVAAIFFNLSQRFEASLLSSLSTALGDDVRLNVAESRHEAERERELIERMSGDADAIVIFPTCAPENNEILASYVADGYPIVCLDRYPETVQTDAILTDHYGASLHGMRWLFDRGHRAVAHLTDFEAHVASTALRLQAYQDAYTERLPEVVPLVRTFPYLAPNSAREYEQAVQLVHDALHAMLSSNRPPTALFCLRDLYAAAAVEASDRLGITIPGDLEILGFLDRQSLLLRRPEHVARIHQDLEEIGRIAADRVRARLAVPTLRPERILVPAAFHTPEVEARSANRPSPRGAVQA